MDSTPTAAEAARKSSTSSSPSNRNQHHQSQHLDNLQKSAVARQPLQLQIPLHPTCGGRFSDGSQSASPSMLASFYNSLHSNGNTNSPQHLPQQQASPRSSDEYWYSLEGYLLMKSQGGALNFLQSKRRLYFGLDELANQLIYYKDKSDFDKKRDCLGAITLDDSVCSLDDGNLCAFFLHFSSVGKKLMLEAESEGCAQGWLRALQQRRDSNDEWGSRELPLLIVDPPRMRRIRSTSEPSEDSSDTGVRGYYSHRPLPPLHLDVADGDITPTPERLQAKQSGHGLPSPSFTTEHEPKSPKPAATVEPASMTDRVSPLPVYSSGSLLNGHRRGVKAASWRKDSHAGMGQRQYTLCRERSLEEVEHEYGLRRSPPGEDPSALQSPRNPNHHQYGNGWVVGGNGEHRTPPEIALISPAHLSPAQLPHPDNHIAHSPDVGSTLTSHCNSRRTSTTSSSTYGMANMAEEITMLRLVNNRQKERNQELNEECNRWRFEAERWRVESEKLKGQLTMSKMGNGTLLSGLSPLAIGPYNHQHQQQLDPASSLAAQNRFLNAEVLRLNDRLSDINNQHAELREHLEKCEEDIDDMRKEYVFLLQSCVRIPLNEHSGCDAIQVKLFGEAVHEKRVKMLLEQARATDHNLPSFESLTQKGTFYIDAYGFKHTFEEVPLALHYISTQLNEHYEQQSEEYLDLKRRWHAILEHDSTAPDSLERSRENRHLCRLGIPRSFRSRVWTLLIGQQVRDIKARFGEYYYRNLCSSQGTPAEKHYCSTHQKQINLDLLRTMPGNKHFASAGCKGVTALEAVLRAFCLHNPKLGYCQGMNFLAATALLFVSPENAFWFLVAITERYFNPSYFDQSLTGAQADQEVLKEIVEQKFPKLAQHLEDCDIDLTTITLNWFLALFFDAVPFQTMLRIWDCFLFEGPKVLFRFTIALLGLYQSEILQHSDTISVMKLLKAAVRLTYDVDGLIKTAFDELNPFPSKDSLKLRQSQFLAVLQEKLFKRQQLRKMYNVVVPASNNSARVCDLPIEVITFNEYVPGCGYVCAGNQRRGKLSLITFHDANAAVLNMLEIEFDCRPVSMVIFHREMAFVSLLSGYIVAVQLREGQAEILWELKLNDVALKLLHCENRLYCPSANGTLSVLENAFEKAPSNLDLIHIPISAAPITDAVMDEEYLYLSVACKVVILNKQTLSTVGCFYVASSAAGSHVPMFEKVRALSNSEYGLWIITAHSSLIQLWSDRECQLLFDITFDHSHRKPSFDEEEHDEQVEAYCIMYHEGEVWVGTVDGYLMFYRVADQAEFLQFGHSSSAHLGSPALTSVDVAVEADEEEEVSGDGDSSPDYPRGSEVSHSPMQKYPQYPPGKRLSPIHNLSSQIIPPHRQQMYYIPTPTETQVEEAATRNEFPESERQTRKISVKIDQATRKYSVNVHSVAKPAACATDAAPPLHPTTPTQCSQQLSRPPPPTPTPSAMLSPTIEEHPTRIDLPPPQSGKVSGDFGRRRATICKGSSVDSAVSVFSGTPSDGGACSTTTSSKDSGYVIRNHSHGSSAARIVLNHPLVRRRRGTKVGGSGGANCSPQPQSSPQLMRRKSTTAGRCRMDINFGAVSIDSPSPFLRHGSLEYDDYFELYPDDGGHNERRANGTSEKPMVKIPSSLKARGESANDVGDGVSDVFPLPDISSTDYPLPSSLPPTLPSFITTMASAPNTTGGHDNTVVALDGEEEDEREAKPDSAYPKTPPPLPAAQLLRSLLNDGEHHNTGGLKVRRKDLEFDDTLFAASVPDMERATHGHSVSFSSVDGNAMKGISARRDSKLISWAVSGGELEEKRMGTLLTMKLQMKMKISDRPVKCITLTRFNGEDVVVTGAGNYGDEEAILRWRRDKNNSGLWINDPLADTCVRGKKRTLISNASTNNRKK